MVSDVSQRQLIIELIRARWILSESRVTQLRGSVRICVLIVCLAQDLLVVTQPPPRKVRHRVAVVCHTPMVQTQSVIEIGKLIVTNTRLPNCVDVVNGKTMGVQVDCTVSGRCSAKRMARDDQFSFWQILHCNQNLRCYALIGVVKAWVTVAAGTSLVFVT